MAEDFVITGLDAVADGIAALPGRIQKGTDKGIRAASKEAKKLLRARMSYEGGGTTPSDMLGKGTGYARKGIRAAIFREAGDLAARVYVASKGFNEMPTPGNIAYINVAGARIRTRGGVLPARSFFEPVQQQVRSFVGDMIDDAVAAEVVKPLTGAF